MPKYQITKKAGRFVAGHRNTGVGTILDLTEAAAAFDLRSGALVAVGAAAPAEADEAPAVNLDAMKKDELIAYAAEQGIDLGDATTKAEIRGEIDRAAAAAAE